jgi:hypothetical protein
VIQKAVVKQETLDSLLRRNQQFIAQYKKSPLMQLITSDEMVKKAARTKLLDCIQVFSNYFQKTIILRHVLCEAAKFLPVTQAHFDEEINHNVSLMRDRKNRPPAWDAILEATAAWFTWKMLTLGDEEKTVLVHLVLEASANVFFHAAHKVMQRYDETDYFKIHAELDEGHEQMGIQLLTNLPPEKYSRLIEVQSQGWDMLNAVCDRMAQVTSTAKVAM